MRHGQLVQMHHVGHAAQQIDHLVRRACVQHGANAQRQPARWPCAGRQVLLRPRVIVRSVIRQIKHLIARRAVLAVRHQLADAVHQCGGGWRLAGVAALVPCKQPARKIGRLQQHVHQIGRQRQLAPTHAVQQRLHLVRELGNVGEPERRGAALDRMRATEDRVELLIIGVGQIHMQQHVLHLFEVLGRLVKEDLVELTEVERSRNARARWGCVGHALLQMNLLRAVVTALAQNFLDHFDQTIGVERLDQPPRGPRRAPGLLHLFAGLGGQDQDRRGLELGVLAQLAGQTDAVEPWHVLIGQHQVDLMRIGLLQRILPIHRLHYVVASTRERERHHFAHGRRVINSKNGWHLNETFIKSSNIVGPKHAT
ncbi:hypothetical protein SDC9_112304 [bioreactor metagenome]|uniref:Uncharacterized protein n=1 Tax=bioreactor metagenome TaxID=1076179 RepID=A0A645BJX9_9ZZZZ